MMTPLARSLRPAALALRRPYATSPTGSVAQPPSPTPSSAPTPSHFATYDPNEEPALAAIGYPKLSSASRQTRPAFGWWDRQERVQFDEAVPLNDDIQSMWAPDVHKVKPFSAFSQLVTAFACVGVFATGVYFIQAPPPGLPRAYPYGGLVKELSGTDDAIYAARPDSANEVAEE